MKRPIFSLLLFLLCSARCLAQDSTASETEALDLVFRSYTAAIRNGDGATALNYISQRSVDYYDTLIRHTLYSDEQALKKINILTRTAILRMRHSHPLAYWDTMTARKLMLQMWRTPEPGTEGLQLVLTGCQAGPAKATCALLLNGAATGIPVLFYREQGAWKIDITSITEAGLAEMTQDRRSRHLSETDYILLTLQSQDGLRVSKEKLYVPLKRKVGKAGTH